MKIIFVLIIILLLLPLLSEASSIKYDHYFKRWANFYFPWEDWKWFKSQGIAESNLNPYAISRCGAMGVLQLMPKTADELGVLNPFDAESNIQCGIKYDRMIDKKLTNITQPDRRNIMFASYNAGSGNINKARKITGNNNWNEISSNLYLITGRHSEETINYVKRINRIIHNI